MRCDFRSQEGSLTSLPNTQLKNKISCNVTLGLQLKREFPWEGYSTAVTFPCDLVLDLFLKPLLEQSR